MKISAKIKPNSRHREEMVANDDGSLTIYTKAPAIEGRANLAAVKLVRSIMAWRHLGSSWCVVWYQETKCLKSQIRALIHFVSLLGNTG